MSMARVYGHARRRPCACYANARVYFDVMHRALCVIYDTTLNTLNDDTNTIHIY